MRIDANVLAWLRPQGRSYQMRINAIPRQEMLKARTVIDKGRVG